MSGFTLVGYALVKPGDSIQGDATYGTFDSQGLLGGAHYGIFDSQSFQGGASVSGMLCNFCTNGSSNGCGIGLYFKVATLPASDTAIFDFNTGPHGSFRAKITSTGHVIVENRIGGGGRSVDCGAISTGLWYWLSASESSNTGGFYWTTVHFYQGGSQLFSFQDFDNIGDSSLSPPASCLFSLGCSTSTAYLSLPNSVGNEISKVAVQNGYQVVQTPLASDPAGAGYVALYLCRDVVGTTTGIVDTTTNHYNLTPGPNGLLVVVDGPYP